MDFNKVILCGLVRDPQYLKKTLPHIKKEYFTGFEYGYLYTLIRKYLAKYKAIPNKDTLKIELHDQNDISDSALNDISELLDEVFSMTFEYEFSWIIDKTEEWCKEKALHNSIRTALELMDSKKGYDTIPDIIRKALQVQFTSSGGQEFLDERDIDARWKRYHEVVTKYSTGVKVLDNCTGGGFEPKAVTVLMSGTNVGKTASMIAIGANMLRDMHDVLYVTLEMSDDKITQRFEANNLDVEINDVPLLDDKRYKNELLKIKSKGQGRLIVKEYPPASINKNNLSALLDDLEIKRNFKPKILIVDYLNLMNSCRFSGESIYSIVKSIIEELRGLAVERELCVLTATQGTRNTNNSKNANIELSDVSESIGTIQTADCVIGIVYPEEMREQNTQIWSMLKNRFGGIVNYKFPIKVNQAKCHIFDCDENLNFQGNGNNQSKANEEGARIIKKNKIKFEGNKEFLEDLDDFINLEPDE